jgi:23S rRNA (uracil1939-C5)-methyltransferase
LLTPELNKIYRVPITSLSHGGSGVGRFEGFVFFVPFTAPGDVVEARITLLKKNYAEAEIVKIIEPGPHRITPPCEYFGECGGCQWQHVDYKEQLVQKQQIVTQNLSRIAKEEGVAIETIVPSPQQWNYRNRAQLRSLEKEVGFFKKKTNELINIQECRIIENQLNERLKVLHEKAAKNPSKKLFKTEIFLNEKGKVLESFNAGHSEETGFSQVNTAQNQNLIDMVLDVVGKPKEGSKKLLDLYCGNGNFSFPLHASGWDVFGVDLNRPAIEQATSRSSIGGINFVCGDTLAEIKKLLVQKKQFDVILLDPPRIGADEKLWEKLVKLGAHTIIYISCNPATFSRDWARLKAAGPYKLELVKPFDMFPQTYHVELLSVARRVNKA